MVDMGDISKGFGKHFLIRAFLPILFVCILNALIHFSLRPATWLAVSGGHLTWLIPLGIAIICFLAQILLSINQQVIRLYEGYYFRKTWPTKQLQRQRDKLFQEIDSIRNRLNSQSSDKQRPQDMARLSLLSYKAEMEYGLRDSEMLPTKLGNVVRAFEHYANTRYSIESITIWPRLQYVMPREALDAIDDQKTSTDFMINASLLLLISGLGWVLFGIYRLEWGISLIGMALLIASYLVYRFAIPIAISWGNEVRSAFDLYRRDVLQKMGMPLPATFSEEKKLWKNVYWFFTYPDYAKREGLPSCSKQDKRQTRKKS